MLFLSGILAVLAVAMYFLSYPAIKAEAGSAMPVGGCLFRAASGVLLLLALLAVAAHYW